MKKLILILFLLCPILALAQVPPIIHNQFTTNTPSLLDATNVLSSFTPPVAGHVMMEDGTYDGNKNSIVMVPSDITDDSNGIGLNRDSFVEGGFIVYHQLSAVSQFSDPNFVIIQQSGGVQDLFQVWNNGQSIKKAWIDSSFAYNGSLLGGTHVQAANLDTGGTFPQENAVNLTGLPASGLAGTGGTVGQVLTSTGPSTSPTWQAGAAGNPTQVTEYTNNGSFTYTVLAGAKDVYVLVIGAGGGGGSGGRFATASIRTGGAGGGGGGRVFATFSAASIGATVAVVVGAGGTAGASQGSDTTAGNNGGAGSTSNFGNFLKATGGGGGGGGGSSTPSTAGTASSGSIYNGGAGGTGTGVTATAGGNGQSSLTYASSGGGGGAGQGAATTTANNGGSGGAMGNTFYNGTLAGGTGGTGSSSSAASPGVADITAYLASGSGGAGYTTAHVGVAGSNGSLYGSGAGGGGASDNTFASGAGGVGAPGAVIVICHF